MKVCSTCKIEKQIDEFCVNRYKKDGKNSICVDCARIKQKSYYEKNRNKVIDKQKIYVNLNFEKVKNYQKTYKETNKELLSLKQSERGKIFYIENKEIFKERHHEYYENNKDKMLEKRKEYIDSNIEKVREYRKKYSLIYKENNRDKLRIIKKEWEKKNKHIIIWRSLLKRTIKQFNKIKNDSTYNLLGYSGIELKEHIESLFTDGMSWSNYGEWQVDHITPLYYFDKNTPPSIVNSLSNLRPLWKLNKEVNGVLYEGNLNRKRIKFNHEEI